MASKHAGWKIYKQQMGLLDHGDALWEPAPIYSYKRVNLGDVGYIRRGRFHLLFSAGCALGSRQLGVDVPPTFEPLDIGHIIYSQPRFSGCLCTSTVKETGGNLSASVSATPLLEPGASFSFELNEKQGAALVTKYRTYREDIELETAFEEYTKRHYDSWVTFARNARHGSDIKPVLVTGVDMTRDFAMIAYSNTGTRLSSEFTTSVPLLASASASAWGKWHTQGLVHTNCGPQLCSTPPSPDAFGLGSVDAIQIDTTPNEYNQCVFIRYYTMRKRALMFPKLIKAAAGPHDLGSGENHRGTLPELTVQSSSDSDTGSDSSCDSTTDCSNSVTSYGTDFEVVHNVSSEDEDPFDVIADYVFENSEAEAVLVHHRDISQIREGIPGTDLSELFLERQPAIAVGSDGVGKVLHRSRQNLAATSVRTTSSAAVAPRHVLCDQTSGLSVRLNQEDAWILSRGLLSLLRIYSKMNETLRPDADSLGHVLDHLSHVPVSGIMFVGRAGVVGMFMVQSTRLPRSLSMPFSLFPLSWQLDPLFLTLRGKVPEEILLVSLAEKHLDTKLTTGGPSEEPLMCDDTFLSVKHTETNVDGERDIRRDILRHSLPQPVGAKKRARLVPRPRSFWFGTQKNTQGEYGHTQRGWNDPLPAAGDLDSDFSSERKSWRHSVQSVTSNGSTANDSRSRPGQSSNSDRFSLRSTRSFSSVLTRFSSSTSSTSLTAPPSSRLSSRGSMLGREKRFSSVRLVDGIPLELDEMVSQPGTPPPPATPTLGSSSSRLLRTIVARRTSSDGRSTHTMEQGMLPAPPKLHGRKYTASLNSFLRKRESSEETSFASGVPESETSSLGRRARFKRFVKDIFKT